MVPLHMTKLVGAGVVPLQIGTEELLVSFCFLVPQQPAAIFPRTNTTKHRKANSWPDGRRQGGYQKQMTTVTVTTDVVSDVMLLEVSLGIMLHLCSATYRQIIKNSFNNRPGKPFCM